MHVEPLSPSPPLGLKYRSRSIDHTVPIGAVHFTVDLLFIFFFSSLANPTNAH